MKVEFMYLFFFSSYIFKCKNQEDGWNCVFTFIWSGSKKIISLAIMSLNIWICDYGFFYMTYVKSERKPSYKHNEQNLSFRPQAINSTKKIWTISYLKRSKRKQVLIIFHQMYLFLYMHIYTLSIDNISSYINIKMPIYWCIIM